MSAVRAGEDGRKRSILEATWRLIAERGYHTVRVQDIAAVCGTSTGTVHYYFPGKQDVLVEALKYCVEQAFARQSVELRAIDDARDRLLRLIELQLPWPGAGVRDEWLIWLQFWTEAATRPELREIHNDFYARWMDTVVRIVRRGQRQGVFRDELDADHAFAQAVSKLNAGDLQHAETELLAFAGQHPRHTAADNALYLAGLIREHDGDCPGAVALFDRIPLTYPAGDAVLPSMVEKGRCLTRMQRKDEAREWAEKIVDDEQFGTRAKDLLSRLR